MTAPLCIAPHCRIRNRHTPDCADGECTGCLPRTAADGLLLCLPHTDWLAQDATALPELFAELALALTGSGESAGRISGSPDTTRLPNPRAVECRAEIRHTLVAYCRLISEERGFALPTRRYVEELPPGFIGPPRLRTVVDDRERALATYVATSAQWLAASDYAADAAGELHDLVRKARRIAYPNGTRVTLVGPCPHEGCEGTIKAILRRVDSPLPSAIVCDVDDSHEWPADQWLTLGRKLRRAA